MIRIFLKFAIRSLSAAGVLIFPILVGASLTGDVFKMAALIVFIAELCFVHFSIYLHNFFGNEFQYSDSFSMTLVNCLVILAASVLISSVMIHYALKNYELDALGFISIFLLCIIYALGRVMMVVVDEVYYILFGEIIPLFAALIFIVVFDRKSLSFFYFIKCAFSMPYFLWAINALLVNFKASNKEQILNWKMVYFKKYFLPNFFSALSLPFLNWFIYSRLSSANVVDLRFAQTFVSPISILISNAKSSLLSGKDYLHAVRLGLSFAVLYLVIVFPLLMILLKFKIHQYNVSINLDSLISSFYILSVSALFIFFNIKNVVHSNYSIFRLRLSIYQFILAIMLSLLIVNFDLSVLVAASVLSIYTFVTVYIVRRYS